MNVSSKGISLIISAPETIIVTNPHGEVNELKGVWTFSLSSVIIVINICQCQGFYIPKFAEMTIIKQNFNSNFKNLRSTTVVI